jgi:hypothetical protein
LLRCFLPATLAGSSGFLFVAMASAGHATDGILSVTGSSLAITSPSVTSAGPIALKGNVQTLQAMVTGFTVTDATGTGSGWHVVVQASGPAGAGALPMRAVSMTEPAVSPRGTDSPPPSVMPGPYLLQFGGPPLPVATAGVDAGMGTYDFSGTQLTLNVPAGADPGSYETTVSLSVLSGP